MLRAPMGRLSASTTIRAPPPIRCVSSNRTASAASMSAVTVLGDRVMNSAMVACLMSMSRSSVRRRSPSVNRPASRPLPSVTPVMPRPLLVISSRASRSAASSSTSGSASPVCMMSATVTSRRRPSEPPGCERAKSSAVKFRASSRAIASASPMARQAVVDEVGASSSGQASSATPTSICTSARRASVDSGLPVMAISGTPRRLSSGRMVRISPVSPEFDSASTTS